MLAFDRAHLWHPYASMVDPVPVWPVISAEGVRLELADGRKLIDGMASWWAAIHGYNHPRLNRALTDQVKSMAHVMFGGLTHAPALALAQKLIALTPDPLQKIFLVDSGSIAVEVAIKMACQYWEAKGQANKCRLLALRGGYHGDTFAAMSVCDPVTGMHRLFSGVLPKQYFAPRPSCRFDDPWDPSAIMDFTRIIELYRDEIAAVILEPIVQGAGGMWFYHPEYLRQVRALCDEHQVLLIADEIATGFGRTGRMFACAHADIVPDILCLGKALTGGYMTLAAVMTTREVAETVSRGGEGILMHGPTFMANPLACAVASASIEMLIGFDWQAQVASIERQIRTELAPCALLPTVREVRVLGAMGVVEMHEPLDLRVWTPRFIEEGIWIRPFGRLVYITPSYSITANDLSLLTKALCRVLARNMAADV